jgi:two-component system cell cycle sensor histidine kinase/response regulator CckA
MALYASRAGNGPKNSGVPRGTETILIVEPDPETRVLAVFMLSRLGYRVLEARNAMDAVKIYSAERDSIDMLFVETLMSKVNGHELAEMLTRENARLRVLFLSDADYTRLTRSVAQKRGLHFMTRPFTMRMLAGRVREVLDTPMAHAMTATH